MSWPAVVGIVVAFLGTNAGTNLVQRMFNQGELERAATVETALVETLTRSSTQWHEAFKACQRKENQDE